jgi:hypothetical protein
MRGGAGPTGAFKILNDTYIYYMDKFAPDLYALVESDLTDARKAIEGGDVELAIRKLVDVFEIASEHGFLKRVQYPGPGKQSYIIFILFFNKNNVYN